MPGFLLNAKDQMAKFYLRKKKNKTRTWSGIKSSN